MTSVAERLLTAEEFMALPDDPSGGKMELVDGKVVTMPPPGEEHGDLSAAVYDLLRAFVRDHDLGKVNFEVEFLLRSGPDLVRAPDVAFAAAARLDPARDRARYVGGAPTLAVDVVSPDDRDREVSEKVLEYLGAGSERVWLVRPRSRSVTVYRPGGDAHVFTGDDTLTSDDAGFTAPGFELRLRDLFA
ncbi:MAG: Uma2 family endonuclease [Chloroflexi bacterium]|nr:Uma2 family endonuclease [Chloroflexota bacterium]